MMRDFVDLDRFLPREVEVTGIAYDNRYVIASQARTGARASLFRDYDNPVDRNAISVNLINGQLGYVPSMVAQVLAPEMDIGTKLNGTITNVIGGNPPRISIEITQDRLASHENAR